MPTTRPTTTQTEAAATTATRGPQGPRPRRMGQRERRREPENHGKGEGLRTTTAGTTQMTTRMGWQDSTTGTSEGQQQQQQTATARTERPERRQPGGMTRGTEMAMGKQGQQPWGRGRQWHRTTKAGGETRQEGSDNDDSDWEDDNKDNNENNEDKGNRRTRKAMTGTPTKWRGIIMMAAG